MPMTPAGREIAISVVPGAMTEVEYYQSITRTILVTNTTGERILVEDLALRFASDSGLATVEVRQECGCELEPSGVLEQQIEVAPTPLFLAATNTFDVMVRFRIAGSRISGPRRAVFSMTSYLIIRHPSIQVGRVFISLKQPEDIDLGREMAVMVRRAGLVPFLKADNERLSEDIWSETIEPALRESDIAIVVWTKNTDWKAEGVEREIAFCRELKIPEALLLAADTSVPPLYEGTSVEYTRFDPSNPAKAFASAADSLRRRILARQAS